MKSHVRFRFNGLGRVGLSPLDGRKTVMEKKNRNRRQRAEARDLARTSGMKYTEALRLIRAAAGGSDEWPAFDALEPDLEGSVVGACRWALERDALGESLNSLLSKDDWEDFDLPDGLTVDHLMVDESVSSFNQDERIEPDRVLGHAIIEAELTILGFEMAAFDANRLVDRGDEHAEQDADGDHDTSSSRRVLLKVGNGVAQSPSVRLSQAGSKPCMRSFGSGG